MPYAAHGTLADLLKQKGALSPEEAGTLLEQIASALQLAYAPPGYQTFQYLVP
jgi:hypothetical protein